MPPNVVTGGYTTYIKSKTQVLCDEVEVKRLLATTKAAMLPKTRATHVKHLDHLRQRFESTTTCAMCGSPLVLRTARSGSNAGHQFFGGSRYPSCRYISKADRVSD